jgi:predicted nucleic acid-binding protein
VILVDTCIWIDHLRMPEPSLSLLLERNQVLAHPFVIGELALGNLRNRASLLDDLQDLPRAVAAENDEVLQFIATHRLFGTGIGYIDAHLLVAARVTGETSVWTRDKRFLSIAERLDLAWSEPKPA